MGFLISYPPPYCFLQFILLLKFTFITFSHNKHANFFPEGSLLYANGRQKLKHLPHFKSKMPRQFRLLVGKIWQIIGWKMLQYMFCKLSTFYTQIASSTGLIKLQISVVADYVYYELYQSVGNLHNDGGRQRERLSKIQDHFIFDAWLKEMFQVIWVMKWELS